MRDRPLSNQTGHMLMEIGFDQAEAVESLIKGSAWTLREIRPDLQGIPRIVVAPEGLSKFVSQPWCLRCICFRAAKERRN